MGKLNPKFVVSVVFVASMFVSILDATIINVALPRIGLALGVSPVDTRTLVVGYVVSMAVIMPATSWLSDRFGTKRVLLLALVLFTSASALCGTATSLPELEAFRILQGLGGGVLIPAGMALMFRTFPPSERMRASQITVIPTAVAPALGPVLGGLLVDKLSWQWVFWVNVPIGIAAILFGAVFLVEHREQTAGRFDPRGFVLSGSGLGMVMYALTEGASLGWTSPVVLATGLTGPVLLAVMVFVSLRTARPILDLRLFGDHLFRIVNVVSLLSMAAFLGALFVLPLLYQNALGASALETGLIAFPEAVGVMIGSQFAGRVHAKVGPRLHLTGSLVAVAGALTLLSLVGEGTDPWITRSIMFGLGLAMGNNFTATQTAAFATLPGSKTGAASTLYNVGRQAGSALGVAVLGGVLTAVGTVTDGARPNLTSYHAAFLVAAGLAAIGAAFALLIRDRDTAPESQRATAERELTGDLG